MLWLVLGRQGYVCNTVQREICSELIFKPQEYHDEHTIDLAILVCLLLQWIIAVLLEKGFLIVQSPVMEKNVTVTPLGSQFMPWSMNF